MIEPETHPETGAPAYLPDARWSWKHALILFGAWLAGIVVASIISVAFFDDPLSSEAVFIVVVPTQSAAMLLGAAYLSNTRGSGSWRRDFGFTIRLRDSWLIIAGVGLQFVAALVTFPFLTLFGGDDPPQQQVSEVVESATASTAVFALIGVVVLAPLVEEILYRGVVLHWLRRRLSRHPAALLTGAIFALVHLIDPGTLLLMPGLFVIGAVLSYSALKNGSLSRPLFLHAGVNLTGFVLGRYSGELSDLQQELEESIESVVAFFG